MAGAIGGALSTALRRRCATTGNVACAVALADKLDAMVGFFGIGMVPTGDKDPFWLRRASLGVLRILMESPLPLDLAELVGDARDRLQRRIVERGFRGPAARFHVRAPAQYAARRGAAPGCSRRGARAAPLPDRSIPLCLLRCSASGRCREAEALAAANKRIVNILVNHLEGGKLLPWMWMWPCCRKQRK